MPRSSIKKSFKSWQFQSFLARSRNKEKDSQAPHLRGQRHWNGPLVIVKPCRFTLFIIVILLFFFFNLLAQRVSFSLRIKLQDRGTTKKPCPLSLLHANEIDYYFIVALAHSRHCRTLHFYSFNLGSLQIGYFCSN